MIVAGGDAIDPDVVSRLPESRLVVAADSGLDEALRLGLVPAVVIGDLDSVSPHALEVATALGAEIIAHPADKDATDLELSLDLVRRRGHRHVVMLGGHGGRMSHLFGNALALTAASLAGMRIEWHVAYATITVVRPDLPLTIQGSPGDLLSLLAVSGPAAGVATSGLRWPLAHETLPPGSTRGISNELVDDWAAVTLQEGVLLAFHERRPI